MVLPYVYRLTHKVTGQFYIGFRYTNKVNSNLDIGVKYFSSSNKIQELGFENFNIEIIAEFFNAVDANIFEQNLIKESFYNDLCLNMNYNINGTIRFNRKGAITSEETKRKMSESSRGLKNGMYGKCGELNPMFGTKMTEKQREIVKRVNSGKNSHMAKRVLVNGIFYDTITEAANVNNCYNSELSNILAKKRKLNNKIWQAEYVN